MSKKRGNPFDATQPAKEYFVGRQSELIELEDHLDTIASGGATNLYIIGAGGEGKTSFLHRIAQEASKKDLISAILTPSGDMQPDDVIVQLIRAALKEIADHFKKDEYYKDFMLGAVSTMFLTTRDHMNQKPIAVQSIELDFERLLKICEQIGAKGIVLCIDEAQRFKSINGGASLAKLRGAIQSRNVGHSIMIVLAALEDILPSIAENNTGVERFFPNRMTLGPFDNENIAVAAIEKRLEGRAISFPRQVSELVARISEYHPKPIVDICHDIYAKTLASGQGVADLNIVRDAIFSRYSEEVSYASSLLSQLLPTERKTLNKVFLIGGLFTAIDIAKSYCNNNDMDCIERMEPIITTELLRLTEKGLCIQITGRAGGNLYKALGGVMGYLIEGELGIH